MKKILLIIFVIIIIIGISYFIDQLAIDKPFVTPVEQNLIADEKNTTYIIDGREVVLVNGRAEEWSAPGAESKTITLYFGNEVKADFNSDGIEDIAFLLTQDSGGSGTFYYVVAALGTNSGYNGTNAVFLGDRIAPQTTEFKNDTIIVNYAERKPGEPFTTQPSVGVSKYLKVFNSELIEVK